MPGPPAKINCFRGPSIFREKISPSLVRVPTAVTRIFPAVNPALRRAAGIRVGSNPSFSPGKTVAPPVLKSTLTSLTPSRRLRAFSTPYAQRGQAIPSTRILASSTWAKSERGKSNGRIPAARPYLNDLPNCHIINPSLKCVPVCSSCFHISHRKPRMKLEVGRSWEPWRSS